MREVSWLLFSVVMLLGAAAEAKTPTGKGPCRDGAECREGVCVEINEKTFCSKACGRCPAGMACDAELFKRVGLSVCVPQATKQTKKPPQAPPRLPCSSDTECPGALVCGQKMGMRDCTLPCTENAQCEMPPVLGARFDFFACQADDGQPSRTACLPKKACMMNPMSCFSMGGVLKAMPGMEDPMAEEDPFADPFANPAEPTAPTAAPAPPPPKPRIQPMSADRFQKLLAQVKAQGFEDERNSVLRTAARSNHFTCDQVGQLIATTNFGDEKLSALRILAPKIVDEENEYLLLDQFKFDDEKHEAEAILGD